MISYDGQVHIIQGAVEFFEAVWVHKRNGTYYLSYSNGPFHGHEPEIAYCTSDNPLGPYTYQGIILGPVNSGTNHHSIVEYHGQSYLFYHTADISRYLDSQRSEEERLREPNFHCGVRRSICCDSLFYQPNGRIKPIIPTINTDRFNNITIGK